MQQDVVLRFSSDRPDFKGTLRSFAAPPDQIGFERHFGISFVAFEQDTRVEWLLWVTWKAWARETHTPIEFDEFAADLEGYDFSEHEGGDVVPPPEAAPTP